MISYEWEAIGEADGGGDGNVVAPVFLSVYFFFFPCCLQVNNKVSLLR